MSERKAPYAQKVKRAAHLLLFKQHKRPGVKGWELRRLLGSDYPKVLEVLNSYLSKIDLQVKTIFEEEPQPMGKPSLEQLERARFYVTLRNGPTLKDVKMMGWRIDDIAGLAITISYVISKGGKVARADLEKLLSEKLPGWRVRTNIDRYVKAGYVSEDESGQLYLGWRTRAEVDQKLLMESILKA